jgi:hypothetical protein
VSKLCEFPTFKGWILHLKAIPHARRFEVDFARKFYFFVVDHGTLQRVEKVAQNQL